MKQVVVVSDQQKAHYHHLLIFAVQREGVSPKGRDVNHPLAAIHTRRKQ